MQTIVGCKIDFDEIPIQYRVPNEIPFDINQWNIVNEEVQTLLGKGAIVECDHEQGEYISTIFIVPKPNGKFRPVINLKYLNENVHYEHFKQETFQVVLDLIQENDFFTSIDLKDAYFSVPIHKDFQKYLKFQFDGILYMFVCLPFGLSSAPRIFTKILKPIYAWFRFHNIRCSYYIDDSLNMNRLKDVCLENSQTIIQVLTDLGFPINDKKSVLQPTQKIVFHGFILDSVLFMIFLTEEKIQKILRKAHALLSKQRVSIRSVASLIGSIVNAFYAVLEAPMHYRSLERDKILGLGGTQNYDGLMFLSNAARQDISWWIQNISVKNGKRIRPKKVSFHMYTDASNLGWGCFVTETDQHCNGRWAISESNFHINYLEMLAIFYGLKSIFSDFENVHIQLSSDSMTCVSFITAMGGMASKPLDDLTKQIWDWCLERNIYISAVHVAGKANVTADFYSRNFSDSTEWMLKKDIFDRLCVQFFTPSIDLFASRLNKQLDVFVSWLPEPGSFGSDALSMQWNDFQPYIFPPFSLVGKVINKIINDKVEKALLIFPFWKSQSWYPLVLSSMISYPVRLPRHKDLLSLSHNNAYHPLCRSMTLIGVAVSGRSCAIKEFQRELQKLSSTPGELEPENSMAWHGRDGVCGVVDNRVIQFVPLKV